MTIKFVNDDNYYTASQLPGDVKPSHYDLVLDTNLKDFKFSGTVKIDLIATNPVKEIFIHMNEIDINNGTVTDVQGNKYNLKEITYGKTLNVAALKFDKSEFEPKLLELEFTGTLNDQLQGFYRTSIDIDGQKIFAGTTQFEPTDARRAFPCFDEPELKATFKVSLIYDKTPIPVKDKAYAPIALSNMDLVSEEKYGDKTIAKFSVTPKMSTYLLAFIIGPFEYLEDFSSLNKIRVRIYTTPGKKEQGRFALDVACKSLDFYEKYFDIKYPMNKSDLIAIPDFSSGAMENWGLVTYRETCVLFDPEKTSTSRKQYIAIVVCHELAHQWFGNLVTMKWWTHLWLNEGFAQFMEHLCVDSIYPEYDVWSQFVCTSLTSSLGLDSLHNSHPIEVPVKFASEINEIFDNISYDKGASIIRMLHHHIGDEKFKLGLSNYLKKHAYDNTKTEDLWDSLGQASGQDITKLMSGWTAQMGFPWLKVDSKSNPDGSVELTIKQSKFTANGEIPSGDENAKWVIPVSIISGSPQFKPLKFVLDDVVKTIVLPNVGEHWLKLNSGFIGFYRVAYPPEIMSKLSKQIEIDLSSREKNPQHNESIGPVDRLNIQSDCFALCRAGLISTVEFLKLVSSFGSETNYTVWSSIDSSLSYLSGLYHDSEFEEPLKSFNRNLYENIYSKLTWNKRDDEKHTDSMLRALVINRLINSEHPTIVNQALNTYRDHVQGKSSLPADLRASVYKAVSIHGDDQDFEHLFKLYRNDSLQEEKTRILSALGWANNETRLDRAVKFAFSNEVRLQDLNIIYSLGANKPDMAWKMLQDRKDYFREKYSSGHMITYIVERCTSHFTTEEKALEVEKFFAENKFPGAERTIQQSLETIRLSCKWLARQRSDSGVLDFLSKFVKPRLIKP